MGIAYSGREVKAVYAGDDSFLGDPGPATEITIDGSVVFRGGPFGELLFEVGQGTDEYRRWEMDEKYFDLNRKNYTDGLHFSEDDSLSDVMWNGDGSKFYELNDDTGTIYSYSMPFLEEYNLKEVPSDTLNSYSSTLFEGARGFSWNNDGTKIYIVDSDNDRIYEYTLSTAYDISTMSYNEGIDTQDAFPESIEWKDDGTKMYTVGSDSDNIYEWNVSTAWDLSTASLNQTINTQDGIPTGIAWNNDGTALYECGLGSDNIYEYSLSTAWDISTATLSNTFPTRSSKIRDILWNDNGAKLYEVEDDSSFYGLVYEFRMMEYYNLSKANYTFADDATQDDLPTDMEWSIHGNKLFELGANTSPGTLYELSASTRFDAGTLSLNDSISTDTSNESTGFTFSKDGFNLYVIGIGTFGSGTEIDQYNLSTAYDISTNSGVANNFTGNDDQPRGIALSHDGTKLYTCGMGGDTTVAGTIYEYTLSTAYDLSTASLSTSISSQDNVPEDITFNKDGTKMFEIGSNSANFYEYDLSTAWDISSATFSTSVSTQDGSPRGMAWGTWFESDQ